MIQTIGQRIRQLRKEHGFTQKEFVDSVKGVSVKKLSDIENGKKVPNKAQMKAIADALGVSVDFLLSEKMAKDKENKEKRPSYIVYTDGGCLSNPGGRGGYGVVLIDRNTSCKTEMSGSFRSTTNNRMEMMAAIVALEQIPVGAKVDLKSDSQYLVRTMKGEFQRRKNFDLWKRLDKALAGKKVFFEWVRGHATNENNNRCDNLATIAMTKGVNLQDDTGYIPVQKPAEPPHKQESRGGAMAVSLDGVAETAAAAEADGKCSLTPEEYAAKFQVGTVCASAIINFLNADNKNFRSYASLKTGGLDYWSGKRRLELIEAAGQEAWQEAMYTLRDEKSAETCLRWVCRGLSVKDGIRKVLVDREISENALRAGKGWH